MMMAAINVCYNKKRTYLSEVNRETDSSEIKYASSIEHIYYPPRKSLILKKKHTFDWRGLDIKWLSCLTIFTSRRGS